jgi:hypothetical protein
MRDASLGTIHVCRVQPGRNGTSREIGRGETPDPSSTLDSGPAPNNTLSTVYATELPPKFTPTPPQRFISFDGTKVALLLPEAFGSRQRLTKASVD